MTHSIFTLSRKSEMLLRDRVIDLARTRSEKQVARYLIRRFADSANDSRSALKFRLLTVIHSRKELETMVVRYLRSLSVDFNDIRRDAITGEWDWWPWGEEAEPFAGADHDEDHGDFLHEGDISNGNFAELEQELENDGYVVEKDEARSDENSTHFRVYEGAASD